ncbi:MAG: hypothetical protein NPIRA02_02270 [Nitrospirales bacterium]|nr:MAG: hypothetical protein NPIRA02_02270 [Nitrospirales bacterium]
MIQVIHGNLIALADTGIFDVIVHGCNCFHTMGAGLAREIRRGFPAAYNADCRTIRGDRRKLGTCSVAQCMTRQGQTLYVVNAYIQYDWRGVGRKADYDAIRRCLRWIGHTFSRYRIGLPMIGSGLAGGDWSLIERIIIEELDNLDVTIVRLLRNSHDHPHVSLLSHPYHESATEFHLQSP